MEIFPAIDLKNGCAVRLEKGEMDSAKVYSKEPCELAKKFADMGARWLHIVDLDGAFAGEPVNFAVIEKIVRATGLSVEVGGGIRDEARIKSYLNAGVKRAILGSVALKNPQFVKEMAAKYRIAVGIDARDGFVAVEGWAQISQMKASELAAAFAGAGVEAIIATDISKDGMLGGLNVDFTIDIARAAGGVGVIASGGVSQMEDIVRLKEVADALAGVGQGGLAAIEAGGLAVLGEGGLAESEMAKITPKIDGVIVGKAYYEGKIDLKEAFKRIF